MWFPNRSDANRLVQAQKRARSLKFRIKVGEELYYPSSENKGADQLLSYCEADLRLCFRLCRLLVFPWGGSITDIVYMLSRDIEFSYAPVSVMGIETKFENSIENRNVHMYEHLFE